jgi:TPR repeat protein
MKQSIKSNFFAIAILYVTLLLTGCQSVGQAIFDHAIDSQNAQNRKKREAAREAYQKELLTKARAGDVEAEYTLGLSIIEWIGTPADREKGWVHMRSAAASGHKRALLMSVKHDYQWCKSRVGLSKLSECASEFSALVDLGKKICGREPNGGRAQTIAGMLSGEYYSRGASRQAMMWLLVNSDRCINSSESYRLKSLVYSPKDSVEHTLSSLAIINSAENDPAIDTVYPQDIARLIRLRVKDLRSEAAAQAIAPIREV